MKKLIGLISVIQAVIGIPVSLHLIANDQKVLGLICLAWFLAVIVFIGEWLIHQLKKVKAFTLIELLAVITVASILLTITFRAFKTDPSKSDARRIASELKYLHSASLHYDEEKAYKQTFTFDKDKFNSDIDISHNEIVFEKGEPLERDYKVEVAYKDLEPIVIYVKPFTGKVTFY